MSNDHSVLIVDDDEGLAHIIALILRQEAFDVRTAANGTHGYADYSRHPTEWVITDIQMPELDGLQMIQCIRTINPSVKTIYMSGEVDKYHTELEQEVSEFDALVLPKPFTKSDLIAKLSSQRRAVIESDSKTPGARPATKEN